MPSWRLRVVCGRGETAAIFWPSSAFEQGRFADVRTTRMATKPERVIGHSLFDL